MSYKYIYFIYKACKLYIKSNLSYGLKMAL
jgi:hypothetical protein